MLIYCICFNLWLMVCVCCRGLFSPLSEDLPPLLPEQMEQSCAPRLTASLLSSHWSASSLHSTLSKTATAQVLCLPDYRPQKGVL